MKSALAFVQMADFGLFNSNSPRIIRLVFFGDSNAQHPVFKLWLTILSDVQLQIKPKTRANLHQNAVSLIKRDAAFLC